MKNNIIKLIFAIIIAWFIIGLISCGGPSRNDRYNRTEKISYTVESINCDGTVLKSWESDGRVDWGQFSMGPHFIDKATGKTTYITGRVIVTRN